MERGEIREEQREDGEITGGEGAVEVRGDKRGVWEEAVGWSRWKEKGWGGCGGDGEGGEKGVGDGESVGVVGRQEGVDMQEKMG